MLSLLRNMRISVKIMVPLALLAVVAIGAGGFVSRTLVAADAQYNQLLGRESRAALFAARLNILTIDLAQAVWRAVAVPDAEGIASSIRDVAAMEADFSGRVGPIRAAVAATALDVVLADIEKDFKGLRLVALDGLRLQQSGQADAARTLLTAGFYRQINDLRAKNRILTETLQATAVRRSEGLSAETGMAVRTAILMLGLGVVLSLALGVWMILAAIARPLGRLHGSMRSLADGNLATVVGETGRGDEIGAMARALQGFATGLRAGEALRLEQEAAKLRAEADRKAVLVGLAGNLQQTVGGVVDGIASAATELNAAATSMVGIADATSTRAGVVSSATAEASGNVNTVAAATEELAASVAEISRQVADSARMATGAVEQANRTNATVANLTEAAAKIGEVTRLIGDIAGQTNLLALNATIEAARAGEAGKGFAVVASEVKALANQTAQATGSIATQIQAMQAATREAAADIGAIRESITGINEVTAAIAAAVEQQGAATRDIAQNDQRAAVGTNESAGAIDGVTAAAAETGGAAGQVQSTSATLAGQAATLRREMGEFLGRIRAA